MLRAFCGCLTAAESNDLSKSDFCRRPRGRWPCRYPELSPPSNAICGLIGPRRNMPRRVLLVPASPYALETVPCFLLGPARTVGTRIRSQTSPLFGTIRLSMPRIESAKIEPGFAGRRLCTSPFATTLFRSWESQHLSLPPSRLGSRVLRPDHGWGPTALERWPLSGRRAKRDGRGKPAAWVAG